MIRHLVRPLLCALAIAAAPVSAAAQLTFLDLPWGAPPHEVSERIRAAGYPLRGTDQWGDLVFGAPHGGTLVAWISPAGLVAVEIEWENDQPGRLPGLFRRMADSLEARYGPATNEHEAMRAWLDREGAMSVMLETRLDSVLVLSHTGLDRSDEIYRRDSLMTLMRDRASDPGYPDSTARGGWAAATPDEWPNTYVDTARFVVLGRQMFGARMRTRMGLPERLANGLLYDGVVTEVELDCAAGRSRLLRTIPLYHYVPTPAIEVPQPRRRWVQPRAGSEEEREIRGACAALARQPQAGPR